MTAALKVVSGGLKNRVLLLPPQGSFILGRSLEANLTLNGPRVEDRHAVLVPEGPGHKLVPLATRRPIWIDNKRVRQVQVLKSGQEIRIGNHKLVYVFPWTRETIVTSTGWGSRLRGRSAATIKDACATCQRPLGPGSGAGASLKALRLGEDVICPRCVDGRLHLEQDLESYRILRKIATNNEEVTYLAVDREKNERVGLRIMKADQQAIVRKFRRFLVRALVGMVIDHQNYLGVQAIRADRGITFVVLQHVEDSTKLEALVRERAPLKVPEAIYVTNQLAEVLRYARERELVVAKRKKSGVLIDPGYWVRVMAYDVTRQLETQVASTDAFADLAERGGHDPTKLATTDLNPRNEDEARLGQLASEFAEVFSVGRILYQLLTGKGFASGTLDLIKASWVGAQKLGEVPKGPLKGCPREIMALMERVLIPKGKDRIRTLADYTASSKAAYAEIVAAGS